MGLNGTGFFTASSAKVQLTIIDFAFALNAGETFGNEMNFSKSAFASE